jgi:hypothetical protein
LLATGPADIATHVANPSDETCTVPEHWVSAVFVVIVLASAGTLNDTVTVELSGIAEAPSAGDVVVTCSGA